MYNTANFEKDYVFLTMTFQFQKLAINDWTFKNYICILRPFLLSYAISLLN